ncbi:MAG: hypothetical protein JXB30_04970 [Anaerolineae bacterium]|nr:hypothetical protein [Anaerolineae bacterium]
MTEKSLQLPPFETNLDDVKQVKEIREEAIARQKDKPSSQGKTSRRKTYKSDRERWKRMVTITLPEQSSYDFLKETAEKMSKERGVEITVTRLGILVMMAGIQLLKAGKLKLSTEPTEVEKMVLKLVDED